MQNCLNDCSSALSPADFSLLPLSPFDMFSLFSHWFLHRTALCYPSIGRLVSPWSLPWQCKALQGLLKIMSRLCLFFTNCLLQNKSYQKRNLSFCFSDSALQVSEDTLLLFFYTFLYNNSWKPLVSLLRCKIQNRATSTSPTATVCRLFHLSINFSLIFQSDKLLSVLMSVGVKRKHCK